MDIIQERLKTHSDDQHKLYNEMQDNDLLSICIPTGAGKGYVMMSDLLNQVVHNEGINVISSHRLMLNSQHLDDVFTVLAPLLGDVGYIFLGSLNFDTEKIRENKIWNDVLRSKQLSHKELISSTISTNELDKFIQFHKKNNRKVVVFTTYNSMFKLSKYDINTLYCDEAHTLASESDQTLFKINYDTITSRRNFFFTATPKDCKEETDFFLMNNEDVFGERVGLTFTECINKGYITKPAIHFARVDGYDSELNYISTENLCEFITDSFKIHKKQIFDNSADPSKIKPKFLVKCASVDQMWQLHEYLNGTVPNVKICGSASRHPAGNDTNFVDDDGFRDRNLYLDEIKRMNSEAIVLHYDTMSEGINVASFTGVLFLSHTLPTIVKIVQNIGRATRVTDIDRYNLRNGIINNEDHSTWIKPISYVILPIWDAISDSVAMELARKLKSLRDDLGYEPIYYISIGSDIAQGVFIDPMDGLNDSTKKSRTYELIKLIKHDVEQLYQEERDDYERQRVNNLTKIELWNEHFAI